MKTEFSLTINCDTNVFDAYVNEIPYVVEEAILNYFRHINNQIEPEVICVEV